MSVSTVLLLGIFSTLFSQIECSSNPISAESSSSSLKTTQISNTPNALCFERLDTKAGQITFEGFPSDKKKAIIGTQSGILSLVSLPLPGTNETIKTISTWLNISPRVVNNGEQGLLGIAFHPNYLTNGRFFVSYICDSNQYPDCKGPCPCTAATGCNPQTEPKAGCRFNTVVAEYWAGPKPGTATKLLGSEVRRILTFARPYGNHNGGNIFFDTEGLFYYTSGDGGSGGDPWNFAQKGNTFLGKILRINVNGRTKTTNYTIPPKNPFVKNKSIKPEIFALGLRNPWRCFLDKITKAIFCGDVGQNKAEEVDRIVAGGNYGWRTFEGSFNFSSNRARVPTTPVSRMIGKLTFPIFEYTHDSVPHGSASITGGVVYRANRNKCLQGKYLFNDYLYPFWVGTVYSTPTSSIVSVKCASDSPIQCQKSSSGNQDSLGNILWSWGEDYANEAYVLSDTGVYRLASLSRCKIAC